MIEFLFGSRRRAQNYIYKKKSMQEVNSLQTCPCFFVLDGILRPSQHYLGTVELVSLPNHTYPGHA